MSDFESLGLKSGIWQGVLTREAAPTRLVLVHSGARVGDARVTRGDRGTWRVAVAIPPEKLSDGVQSFLLIEDAGKDGEALQPGAVHLASLNLAAGTLVDEDLRAELHLMRSELELLKKELRRLATG
ncbi:hypothetical protein RGQ15_01410 [Paracoccus sp. MBLB3053]|uniref:Uncharacterized protein n=1 Tax=Paracoccus aurantius TaxID=3073814 RepID=A0ABU2HNT4_9RHOB|nr:hypothetical protein [Paracoccus sp. MBLB3053]MDS9466230.1 hypothetical protein [Paracoccus sp. MBLB3053]